MIYQRYKPLPLSEHHALKRELPVNKQQRVCIEDREVQSLHIRRKTGEKRRRISSYQVQVPPNDGHEEF